MHAACISEARKTQAIRQRGCVSLAQPSAYLIGSFGFLAQTAAARVSQLALQLGVLELAHLVFARPMGGAAVLALGDVPRQAEVGAGNLEELRALAGIAKPLGRAHAAQCLAVVLVAFVHGGDPG